MPMHRGGLEEDMRNSPHGLRINHAPKAQHVYAKCVLTLRTRGALVADMKSRGTPV
jgi:hypothetical protein